MLKWRGEEVKKKILNDAAQAMDATMADCVGEAKATVPVRTSALQGSIQMRPTKMASKTTLVGFWGSFGIKYALAVELGTGPHEIRPTRKQALYWPGAEHPVRVVHHPGTAAKPYLRPAADRIYPTLVNRIRRLAN